MFQIRPFTTTIIIIIINIDFFIIISISFSFHFKIFIPSGEAGLRTLVMLYMEEKADGGLGA